MKEKVLNLLSIRPENIIDKIVKTDIWYINPLSMKHTFITIQN